MHETSCADVRLLMTLTNIHSVETRNVKIHSVETRYVKKSCKPLFGWLGGNGEGVPPDPIPNSAVKPLSADGTAS